MNVWQALILGLVQGFTEFLPISSSGHLVLANHLMQVDVGGIAFEVAVHLGTLLAVIIYFWRDLTMVVVDFFRGGEGRRIGWMLLLAMVPTAILGIGFKPIIESLFDAPRFTAAGLLVTTVLLIAAERVRQGDRPLGKVRKRDALLIGTMQGMAIMPGISRSGSTISGALFSGLGRDAAARFSFLLSIPAILGAAVVTAKDFTTLPEGMTLPFSVGFIASAVSGYIAIGILMAVLRKGKLYGFAVYTAIVGILGLIFL
ncbi:undecaprenyl-diphosphatase UppP [bacterium]|nr:undecaprenyl-diphosphatase UppP [bacterium]